MRNASIAKATGQEKGKKRPATAVPQVTLPADELLSVTSKSLARHRQTLVEVREMFAAFTPEQWDAYAICYEEAMAVACRMIGGARKGRERRDSQVWAELAQRNRKLRGYAEVLRAKEPGISDRALAAKLIRLPDVRHLSSARVRAIISRGSSSRT